MAKTTTTPNLDARDALRERARKLGFHGLATAWDEVANQAWIESLITREENDRHHRSHDRRIRRAKIGRFKMMADYDWAWPRKIDREQIEELFTLGFLREKINPIFIGPNGVGKSMITQNLTYAAVVAGHTVLFTTASQLLNDLGSPENSHSFERRLRKYTQPQLLAIDELGYLSFDSRGADLLFEVVTRRYEEKSTIVSTNRAFAQWNETFPNASCVVALVDRLIHRSEIVEIDGESYRHKEAMERAKVRAKERRARTGSKGARPKDAVPGEVDHAD